MYIVSDVANKIETLDKYFGKMLAGINFVKSLARTTALPKEMKNQWQSDFRSKIMETEMKEGKKTELAGARMSDSFQANSSANFGVCLCQRRQNKKHHSISSNHP